MIVKTVLKSLGFLVLGVFIPGFVLACNWGDGIVYTVVFVAVVTSYVGFREGSCIPLYVLLSAVLSLPMLYLLIKAFDLISWDMLPLLLFEGGLIITYFLEIVIYFVIRLIKKVRNASPSSDPMSDAEGETAKAEEKS